MVKEYWNLIGQHPFLAITWELDFSQARSFHRMLMNHKTFHFTQIPYKANDVIFLKSPKTVFLDHFWPFLVIFARWGFFPKNLAVTHNYIQAPNTMLNCRKKLISQSRENLRTDGRTTGQPIFYRTLPSEAGGPKKESDVSSLENNITYFKCPFYVLY